MARPYASEMAKLPDTFAWAASVDIERLRQAVRTAGIFPLRAIGSGGSLSAAHALAAFHQRFTGRMATVATPLEAASEHLDAAVTNWLLSAGGGNVDIVGAAKALIGCEPRQIAVLCGREDSPLAALCSKHSFVDLLLYPQPAGKDGFLATNSLLGFVALLARAYAIEFDGEQEWTDTAESLQALLTEHFEDWENSTAPLWQRPTTLVLHGPTTRIGAIDLESKFTEAALGNLQIADYRNFAHGRHHWLAKRGDSSAILAFITDTDRSLAERTLALIPPDVPQARISFAGNATTAALAALVAALRITGWAGTARGIDPGRPGVPDFGRKLYNLPLPRPGKATSLVGLSARDGAAIARKAGYAPSRLAALGELDFWRQALKDFRKRLHHTPFAGIVLDYDGTIIDPRSRFIPPDMAVSEELARIADTGAWVAIATGRGASVRRDLQARLPKAVWPRVLVGYYNGADIAWLDDDNAPNGSEGTCPALAPLAAALRGHPELASTVRQTDRPHQITLEAVRLMPEGRLWDIAHQIILTTGAPGVSVTRSSHSIDIVAAGVSKLNVLSRLRERAGAAPLLTVGDRGRWPGNDYELLREPYSLSVDEVSFAPNTCWNLAEPGQRGATATLGYLSSLRACDGLLMFAEDAFR